jgi:hypothetical protein
MADVERRITVAVSADTAFELLADASRLPEYVAGLRLEDAVAVEGDPAADTSQEAGPPFPAARFHPDRAARRVEWELPGTEYRGSAEVGQLLPAVSTITIRLHTAGGGDLKALERSLEETGRNLQRLLTRA